MGTLTCVGYFGRPPVAMTMCSAESSICKINQERHRSKLPCCGAKDTAQQHKHSWYQRQQQKLHCGHPSKGLNAQRCYRVAASMLALPAAQRSHRARITSRVYWIREGQVLGTRDILTPRTSVFMYPPDILPPQIPHNPMKRVASSLSGHLK